MATIDGTTVTLDICTPEGKTWLARVTGADRKYGLQREFVSPVERTTSRSGRTGSAVYVLTDGLYEANEGRRRLGKTYLSCNDGAVIEIEREQLLGRLS